MILTRLLIQRLLPGLLIALVSQYAHTSAAQDILIQNFTVREGLPDNIVFSIAQETDGRFWVATETGISEYSAGRFSADEIGDFARIHARALLVIPEHDSVMQMDTLYVGSETGLIYINSSSQWPKEILAQNGLEPAEVHVLFADAKATVWVGTDSYLANCLKDICHQIAVEALPLPINAITEDSLGHIWVGGESNDVVILDGESLIARLTLADGMPAGCSVNAMLTDPQGEIWVGTNFGLVHFVEQQIVEILTESQGLVSDLVSSLLPAHSGGIWVGTSAGLQRLMNGDWVETYTIQDHLASSDVTTLIYDQEGNLWAGTNGGLSRLHLSAWQKEVDPLINLHSIEFILPSTNGHSYVVTDQGIAVGQPGDRWQLVSGSEGQTFYCLEADNQGTVYACGQQGLYSIRSDQLVIDPRIQSGQVVSALLFDTDDTVWVGMDTGLVHLVDERTAIPVDDPAVAGKAVSSLWKTQTGDLWVGLSNGGASRLQNGSWINTNTLDYGLSSNFVFDGLENVDGSIWFGTLDGISILAPGADPKMGLSWSHVSIPQNLPSGFGPPSYRNSGPVDELLTPTVSSLQVAALLSDVRKPGMIWVGTDNGLNVIQGHFSSTFDVEDGLNTNSIRSLAQTPDGRLWVGTDFGMLYHQDHVIAPRLSVPAWRVNGESYNPDYADALAYSQKTAWIGFPASDLNDLTGIMYRLEIWRQDGSANPQIQKLVETRQEAYELTLDPGSQYSVKVTAYDREMNPSKILSSPTLSVKPITWLEWLAAHPAIAVVVILAAALTLASVFYLAFRSWRLRQQKAFPLLISASLYPDLETGGIEVAWEARRRFKKEQGKHKFSFDLTAYNKIDQQVRELIGRDPALLRQLGEVLWKGLFLPEEENRLLDLKIGNWPGRLYVSVARECAEYSVLAWEYAFGGQGIGHVTRAQNPLSLVRLSAVGQSDSSSGPDTGTHKYSSLRVSRQRKLRILVAWANPQARYLPDLRYLENEVAAIKNTIESSKHAAEIEWKELRNATWDAFEQEVRTGYDLIHFSGHAGVFRDKKVLFFELEGGPRPKSLTDLVHLFECRSVETGQGNALVVLNACRSAEASASSGLIGLAESLTSLAGVPCAVGMGYPISEDSGITFSSAFYSALLKNGQVDYAMTEARKALSNHEPGRRDWGIPRIFVREKINVLFEWP
jgi:ligand-binding sensor domain-containing protein